MSKYTFNIKFLNNRRIERTVDASCFEDAHERVMDSLTESQQKNIMRIDLVKEKNNATHHSTY